MPPKRRKIKESEDELQFNQDLRMAFFKYQLEEEIDMSSNGHGMFEIENPVVSLESLPAITEELNLIWDSAVVSILSAEQKSRKIVDLKTAKTLFEVLKTCILKEDDVKYLFNTFSDSETKLITEKSLSQALRNLNIRESAERVGLLLAFAHEQSFLQLLLSEQVQNQPMVNFANRSGVCFDEFKRVFLRSSHLSDLV